MTSIPDNLALASSQDVPINKIKVEELDSDQQQISGWLFSVYLFGEIIILELDISEQQIPSSVVGGKSSITLGPRYRKGLFHNGVVSKVNTVLCAKR